MAGGARATTSSAGRTITDTFNSSEDNPNTAGTLASEKLHSLHERPCSLQRPMTEPLSPGSRTSTRNGNGKRVEISDRPVPGAVFATIQAHTACIVAECIPAQTADEITVVLRIKMQDVKAEIQIEEEVKAEITMEEDIKPKAE